MKQCIALILTFVLLLSLLTGCGGGTEPAQNTVQDPAPEVSAALSGAGEVPAPDAGDETPLQASLTVWYPDTWNDQAPTFAENWQAAIAAAYPGVNVTFEQYVQASILEKLTVAMATGTTPDILFDVQSRVISAATTGFLADMSDLAAELSSRFAGDYAEVGRFGDEILYLPFDSMNCYSIMVNMDIAREIGADAYLPADSVHWSFDDFLKCCELAKEHGYFGTQLFAGGTTGDAAMFSMYMTAGSQLFSDDLTACTINNDGTRATLELLKTLIDNEYVPAGAATTIDYTEAFYAEKALFAIPQGGVAGILLRNNAYEAGEISSVFDMDFVMYPSRDGKAEPVSACFGTNGFCIFRNDGDADTIAAAKAIVKLVYEDPSYMAEKVQYSGTSPVLEGITPEVEARFTPFAEKQADFTANYMTVSCGILEGWWSDWRNAYYPVMQKFYAGDATVDETLAELERAGNDVIAAYTAANS